MNLFDMNENTRQLPLASRMRPEKLDEIVGQLHIIGKDKLLYRAIKADRLGSIILYGPPGVGKTTIARVIANTTKSYFCKLNATNAGIKDLEKIIEEAKFNQNAYQKGTILFIDEIHRFNKTQQDYLLPFVEDGIVILIGATTENPYFEVNNALLSRCRIFELKPLEKDDLITLIDRTLKDQEKGLGKEKIIIDENAKSFLVDQAGGDARSVLNALELAYLTTERNKKGIISITLEVAEQCIQKKAIRYDKNGDNHYDIVSAFIKSMRGSDPDAALHYLARMLVAGEDINFIARRIAICASEDVGNADPQALVLAMATVQAVQFLGMPEARIPLAQAVTYIASAPKSNASYLAIDKAIEQVKSQDCGQVPIHLRDCHYKGAKKLGHGVDYKYAHDYPYHIVKQQYLPDKIKNAKYYMPTSNGYEEKIGRYMQFCEKIKA